MQQRPLRKKFFQNKWFFLLLFILFVITVSLLIFGNMYFSIKQVEIVSPDKNLKIRGIEKFQGSNILFLSEDSIGQILYERNPQIKKVFVEKKYPQTLKLFLETEDPISGLSVSGGFFYLSENGKILQKTKKRISSIHVISYYQKLSYLTYAYGDVIDFKDIKTALFFIKKVKDLGLRILSVDIAGVNMVRLEIQSGSLIFTSQKSIRNQEYELTTVIRQFKIEGRAFESIDFRFNKPVIKLR